MKKAFIYLLSILILSAYSLYFIKIYHLENTDFLYLAYPLILFLVFPLQIVDFIPKAIGLGCDSQYALISGEYYPHCSPYYVYPMFILLILLEWTLLTLIIAFLSHRLKKR